MEWEKFIHLNPNHLKPLNRLTDGSEAGRHRRWLLAFSLLLAVLGVSGCHTIGFYGQAVKGQYQIFTHQQSIDKLLASADTPRPLKERFELLRDLRAFASTDLKLPTDSHYRKYVDVHRPFVVWNVEAAREFSMAPKTWWYPLLGSLEYRGYFSKWSATNYAAYLRTKGYDVSVGGVEAYSTLGWFEDPVLNTFIFEPDAELAEIIFHELGHQRLFARGDTDFNEAFATTVGQEGARRWLKAKGNISGLNAYLAHLQRSDQFVHLVMSTRAKLEALYGDERTEDGKIKASEKNHGADPDHLRERKQGILREMQTEYERLKVNWGGDTEYDEWFAHPINNSHLNSVAAYYDFLPAFEQLLAANGGDLEKFYQAAARLSKRPKRDRHERLRILAQARLVPSARAQNAQPQGKAG